MTRASRPAPRKRASPRRASPRSRSPATRRLPRFLRALVLSATASFGVASYLLNPSWQPQSLSAALSAWLAWPPAPAAPVVVAPGGALAQTRFDGCPQFFPGGHAPAVPAAPQLRELCFDEFAVLHSGSTRTPVFVAQRLDRQTLLQARGNERTDRFYAEARLPRRERAELDDYRRSGYSRGHMAPAADMATGPGIAQSFSLANMVPQDQSQNSGPWSRIEQDTRKYVLRSGGDVYVYTGPVYAQGHQAIGQGVAVPDYLFKLVYDARSGRSWVHWQANHADARVGAPISYPDFVKQTGLRLLPAP